MKIDHARILFHRRNERIKMKIGPRSTLSPNHGCMDVDGKVMCQWSRSKASVRGRARQQNVQPERVGDSSRPDELRIRDRSIISVTRFISLIALPNNLMSLIALANNTVVLAHGLPGLLSQEITVLLVLIFSFDDCGLTPTFNLACPVDSAAPSPSTCWSAAVRAARAVRWISAGRALRYASHLQHNRWASVVASG